MNIEWLVVFLLVGGSLWHVLRGAINGVRAASARNAPGCSACNACGSCPPPRR